MFFDRRVFGRERLHVYRYFDCVRCITSRLIQGENGSQVECKQRPSGSLYQVRTNEILSESDRERKKERKGENRQVLHERVNTCTTHACSDKKKRRKLFESLIFHSLCILQHSYRPTTFLSFGLLCFIFLFPSLALLAKKRQSPNKNGGEGNVQRKNANFGRDYVEFIVRIFLNDVKQLRKQIRNKKTKFYRTLFNDSY